MSSDKRTNLPSESLYGKKILASQFFQEKIATRNFSNNGFRGRFWAIEGPFSGVAAEMAFSPTAP